MGSDRGAMRRRLYASVAGNQRLERALDEATNHEPNPELSEDDLTEMLHGDCMPWLERWARRFGCQDIGALQTHAGRFLSDMGDDVEDAAWADLYAMVWWLARERPRTEHPDLYTIDPVKRVRGVDECLRGWAWANNVSMDCVAEIMACLWTQQALDFSQIDMHMLDVLKRQRKGK